MEHQTSEQFDLYARKQSAGDLLPNFITPVEVNNSVQMNGKIPAAASQLTNGRAAGANTSSSRH